MNLAVVVLLLVMLVFLDKTLTYINVVQFNKNFPDVAKNDHYKIEKNPLAKWFFVKLGLLGGTIVYGFVSVLTLLLAYGVFRTFLNAQMSLFIIFMIYGLVIFNNFFFMFKYMKVIS